MSTTNSQLTGLIGRLTRGAADIVAQCNYATRRMTEVTTAPDRFLPDPDRAPDTYAEFLFRTSGVLPHEASARARGRAGARR